MKKVIVTLRSANAATVDVPGTFPRARGKRGEKEKPRAIERSVYGTLKLFPGVPRAISKDELEFVKLVRPELEFEVRSYVESKRVDLRGASETEIAELAEKEGIGHLDLRRQLARLTERGKIKSPGPKRATAHVIQGKKRESSSRKPK